MGRNNERNIKKHNDKLHKAQDKAKKAAAERREKLSAIVKKYNEQNPGQTIMEDQFDELKQQTQEIIDLITTKQYQQAIEKHAAACDLLDELIDHADDDDHLVELSRYQVLLNHLQQKIHN